MSKKRGFLEAPYDSRTDWMTVADAAKALGVRLNQVQGWAQNMHVVSCKHGRRRLVSLSSCREHLHRAELRSPRTWSGNPPNIDTEPTQSVTCEIVPVDVSGRQLVGARLDGQEVIAVRLLEELLGLAYGSLAQKMRRRIDFVSGVHMFKLSGLQLRAYKRELSYKMSESSNLPTLNVLTAAGVSMALMLGDSDICRRLRRELSTSGFMQSVGEAVISGDGEKFARTLADDATDALAKLRLFVTTELSEMQGHLAAALEENQNLRQQLDENTYKIDMVDKRLVHMPDDVARSLAPMIAEMARKTHSTGPGFVRDPLLPRPIRPGEDAYYYPRLSSTDVAHKVRRGLPRSQSGSINTQAINACGQKYARQYWSDRGKEFFGQDWPGYIEKGQSKYGTLRYWYSEAFIPKALKWFRSGQLDLPFTGQQP